MKWGEYSSEVQLILRKSFPEGNKAQGSAGSRSTQRSNTNGLPSTQSEGTYYKDGKYPGPAAQEWQDFTRNPMVSASPENDEPKGMERNRDIRTSLTFGGLCSTVQENTSEVRFLCLVNKSL